MSQCGIRSIDSRDGTEMALALLEFSQPPSLTTIRGFGHEPSTSPGYVEIR